MVQINIEPEYGYVVLAATSAFALNFWQVNRIAILRRKYAIKYPVVTSDKHEDFNIAQRVHANTLEVHYSAIFNTNQF